MKLGVMAEKDLKKWTTFFQAAGVPRGPAAEYAALFCNHRIKDNLLGDLTKEILNDMGITIIGDIISILKHAKAVFLKLEREKSSNQLVQDSESVEEPLSKENPPPVQISTQVKKKKVVSKLSSKPNTENNCPDTKTPDSITIDSQRIVILQVQQPKVLMSTTRAKLTAAEPKITVTVDDAPVVTAKKRPAKMTMSLSERFASETASQPKVTAVAVKKKKEAQTSTVQVLTKTSTEKMDSIEKEVTSVPVKRKSAFERLGKEEESHVPKEMERLSPKIKITKVTKSPITAPPASTVISLVKNESSVFNRLGESDTSSVASTNRTGALTIRTARGSRIVSDDSSEKPVKSHSVLRPLKPIRAVQPVKPVSPVKARVSADATKESSRKSVFSRLGSQT